eukprot:CAMPEP_0197875738 /NCGR_PEP_ID=MMETSP1439-20131203/4917_1 /TAXON_ID=66791 /ORGANISM="Gonyaulax spinifera, Strain CCMP409" /LENGTH=77 /DNA_ID=CAMNT_0043494969 /DNA_START=59 /DNA_END=292 /DNA_ORIENTATION=-
MAEAATGVIATAAAAAAEAACCRRVLSQPRMAPTPRLAAAMAAVLAPASAGGGTGSGAAETGLARPLVVALPDVGAT